MKKYTSTKIINEKPMNLVDYNSYRGCDLPVDENPLAEGYLVGYQNSGKTNQENHKRYSSGSPKDVFEETYKSSGNLDFGSAITLIKEGRLLARKGWNGNGMYIFLVPGSTFKVNREPLNRILEEGTEVNYLPHIDMKTVDGEIVPWLASQSDMLAEDWEVINA